MELLKVLDENGQETGEIVDREVIHQKGLWHREVEIWIFNDKGKILLQRRSKNKKQLPNKLATCAGHVESTKTSLETAIIELFEEIGLSVNQKDLVFLKTFKKELIFGPKSINRIFDDNYFVITNKNINEFKIQEEELSEVFWIDYSEFKKRLTNHDEEIIYNYENMVKNGTLDILDDLYQKIINGK